MNPTGISTKAIALALILLAVGAVLYFKSGLKTTGEPSQPMAYGLPALVDLGATTCVPCRKMAPILDELRETFAGRFEIQFIDVWKNPDAAIPYRMRLIPTQIFFDAEGRELYRHEGFFSREEILGKWRELGFSFEAKGDRP